MAEETQDEQDRQLKNMEIWNRVSRTDLDHTKEVKFGRKFTAIDAHSQIMEATRAFGPIGNGWGYENTYGETTLANGMIIVWCDVVFWWVCEGLHADVKNKFGPVRGAAVMTPFEKGSQTKFKVPDTDAYKKASTDGLTKLISHLGFNADVFLGMFDDNKYIQELKKEKSQAATAAEQEYQQARKGFVEKVRACKKQKDIDAVMADYKLWIERLPPTTAVELRAWVAKTEGELKEKGK